MGGQKLLSSRLSNDHRCIVRPENSGLSLVFEGFGLECFGFGLAGQVLALTLAYVVQLQYINSNI